MKKLVLDSLLLVMAIWFSDFAVLRRMLDGFPPVAGMVIWFTLAAIWLNGFLT